MNPFDELATDYDQWFDSGQGTILFRQELACIRSLTGAHLDGEWLEVGVGTGRFASALSVGWGVDPSQAMLRIARARGIHCLLGTAESLPFGGPCFNGVLMTTTVCFVEDLKRAFAECSRVLVKGGRLVVGFVPAESEWGRLYTRKGEMGHPYYSHARMRSTDQVLEAAESAWFSYVNGSSCLFTKPDEPPKDMPVMNGLWPDAGFVAMSFQRP